MEPESTPAISIRIDTMRYPGMPPSANLVEALSLDVQSNEFVSLLGRTGAGKTTLLRMVAGLERRYSGSVSVDGIPVTRPSRDVQMVFQDFRLLPWKTVFENIAFATDSRRRASELSRVDKWIDIVGLNHRRNALPKTLSGGEAGRAVFARAFVDQPKVLLLDEPFRGLDLVTRFGLQDELRKALAEQHATVMMVSHSINDAVFLSDAVYVLTDAPMTVEKVFPVKIARPRHRGDPQLASLSAEITRYLETERQTAL